MARTGQATLATVYSTRLTMLPTLVFAFSLACSSPENDDTDFDAGQRKTGDAGVYDAAQDAQPIEPTFDEGRCGERIYTQPDTVRIDWLENTEQLSTLVGTTNDFHVRAFLTAQGHPVAGITTRVEIPGLQGSSVQEVVSSEGGVVTATLTGSFADAGVFPIIVTALGVPVELNAVAQRPLYAHTSPQAIRYRMARTDTLLSIHTGDEFSIVPIMSPLTSDTGESSEAIRQALLNTELTISTAPLQSWLSPEDLSIDEFRIPWEAPIEGNVLDVTRYYLGHQLLYKAKKAGDYLVHVQYRIPELEIVNATEFRVTVKNPFACYAPSFEPFQVVPAASTEIRSHVSCYGPPTFHQETVLLERVDSAGQWIADTTTLYDDGTHGDSFAGDFTYTHQLEFPTESEEQRYYRIRSETSDPLIPAFGGTSRFTVTNLPQDRTRPSDAPVTDEDTGERFIPNELLVRFCPGTSSERMREIATGAGSSILSLLAPLDFSVMDLPNHATLESLDAAGALFLAYPEVKSVSNNAPLDPL